MRSFVRIVSLRLFCPTKQSGRVVRRLFCPTKRSGRVVRVDIPGFAESVFLTPWRTFSSGILELVVSSGSLNWSSVYLGFLCEFVWSVPFSHKWCQRVRERQMSEPSFLTERGEADWSLRSPSIYGQENN